MTQLAGNIEDLGLGEILQIISFSRKSGILHLQRGSVEGVIAFRNGNVIAASTDAIKEDVFGVLIRLGIITDGDLEAALEMQKEGGYIEGIGTILGREFNVSTKEMNTIAIKLVEKAVFSFFRWTDGTFIFELADYGDSSNVIKDEPLHYVLAEGLNPQFLAMEGLRLLDESKKEKAPSKEMVKEESYAAEPMAENLGGESRGKGESLYYFQDILEDIGKEVVFPKMKETTQRVTESKGLRLLKEMLSELAKPLSLNEIVLLVLRFSSELVNRAVVFGVKKGNIVGLGQFGVEIEGESPNRRIKKMSIPLTEPSILRDAIVKKGIIAQDTLNSISWNDYIINQLGGHKPCGAFALPVIVQDKVAMLLYGDNLPEEKPPGDISTLEIFLAQTSIVLERLMLRKTIGKGAGV